ncbi:MAG: hypothetical protein KAI66_24770 [Lentisphaeria bacterium]|nr:hypothetical protein [Lentisphaeria bacterium]
MLTILPMLIVIRLTGPHLGHAGALALAWIVFVSILIPLTMVHWRQPPAGTGEMMKDEG